mmetsp:Transcript_9196/g.6549  ORF Transcript_9196/g.6549 Transcript_9196/m.6549 type:complete len:209 (-) Transcript_9196:70-696(-)
MLGILFPFYTFFTITGQKWYSYIYRHELDCYPESANPWTVTFNLCLAWFLVSIYFMLGCSYGFLYSKKTRLRFLMRQFIEDMDEDELLNNIMEDGANNNRDNDNENELNQSLLDDEEAPLRHTELKDIETIKADESMTGETCSICFDNFKPKQKLRKMPECSHLFHRECIDHWLKTRPTCPNCNRNVREVNQRRTSNASSASGATLSA